MTVRSAKCRLDGVTGAWGSICFDMHLFGTSPRSLRRVRPGKNRLRRGEAVSSLNVGG